MLKALLHKTAFLLRANIFDYRVKFLPDPALYPFTVGTLRLVSAILSDNVILLATGCLA